MNRTLYTYGFFLIFKYGFIRNIRSTPLAVHQYATGHRLRITALQEQIKLHCYIADNINKQKYFTRSPLPLQSLSSRNFLSTVENRTQVGKILFTQSNLVNNLICLWINQNRGTPSRNECVPSPLRT
jgi:hypothetical protein